MTDEDDRKQFIGLLQRFNQLGVQLPTESDILDKNTRAAAISTARILLAEMDQTKSEIDKLLGIKHRPLGRARNTDSAN